MFSRTLKGTKTIDVDIESHSTFEMSTKKQHQPNWNTQRS